MPTYKRIQQEVQATAGFVPKTCWIAHCFEISGKKTCQAWNRLKRNARQHPCPPEKQVAILQAILKSEPTKEAK